LIIRAYAGTVQPHFVSNPKPWLPNPRPPSHHSFRRWSRLLFLEQDNNRAYVRMRTTHMYIYIYIEIVYRYRCMSCCICFLLAAYPQWHCCPFFSLPAYPQRQVKREYSIREVLVNSV